MLTCKGKTYKRLKQLILTENLPKGEFLPQRDRGNVRNEVFTWKVTPELIRNGDNRVSIRSCDTNITTIMKIELTSEQSNCKQ